VSAQTSSAGGIKRDIGVISLSGFGVRGGGDPRQFHGLLMVKVHAAGLIDCALHLEPSRRGVGGCGFGALFRRLQPSEVEIERIPAQAEAASEHEQKDDNE